MSILKNIFSKQKRINNFSETVAGFTKKQAQEEALRCPQPTSHVQAQRCPLGVDVFSFIRSLREGDTVGALQKIREQNPLPGICGRVCSAPCQSKLGDEQAWSVDIRSLERFAYDQGDKRAGAAPAAKRKEKIAIVGSGPAGLVCAHELAKVGFGVTIFEALHLPGGVLRYAIPEFRLPKKILDAEITHLQSFGVEIKTNCFIGQTISILELFEMGFSAVYLATGSGVPQGFGITGESLKGVYWMSEFLMSLNLSTAKPHDPSNDIFHSGKKVAVLGSGTIALDCARAALRLGKDVVFVYERSEDELLALRQDINFAKEEGIRFEFFARALEILGDGHNHARGVKCVRVDFADVDSSGKWQLKEVEGSEFMIDADHVIVSGKHQPNSIIAKFTNGLKTNPNETFVTNNDHFETSIPGVFAGGDCAMGAGPLITAMASAKKVAMEIDRYLQDLVK